MASVDFGQQKLWSTQSRPQRGRGRDGLRLRGVWGNSGGRFSARAGRRRLQNCGRRVLSWPQSLHQYDPKVILGAKALDPKGDAYSGS